MYCLFLSRSSRLHLWTICLALACTSASMGGPTIRVRSGNMNEIPSGTTEVTEAAGTFLGYGTVGFSPLQVYTQTKLHLLNEGDADLVISNVSVSGGAAGDFFTSMNPDAGTAIGPGGYAYLYINGRPYGPGVRNTTLTITSNDVARPNYSFNIGIYGIDEESIAELPDFEGDFIGSTITPKFKGGVPSTKVKMYINIDNFGALKGKPADIKFYFSTDNFLDSGDALVAQKPFKKVPIGSARKKISFTYPGPITGLRLFAIISPPVDGVEYQATNNGIFQEF